MSRYYTEEKRPYEEEFEWYRSRIEFCGSVCQWLIISILSSKGVFMYKHLYDCFAHWYHGGTIYFYSDPHFADAEMKDIRKDYISDEKQVARIRSKIGKNDTLIILGDVGDKEWLKKLRGYKVLVLGNHDSGASTYKDYVDEVYEGALMISDKIILSHEPINFPYALNIHGHCHALPHKYADGYLNMCAEAINYTPVPIKEIIESGILKEIPSIHRETIDTATERKKKRIKNI